MKTHTCALCRTIFLEELILILLWLRMTSTERILFWKTFSLELFFFFLVRMKLQGTNICLGTWGLTDQSCDSSTLEENDMYLASAHCESA